MEDSSRGGAAPVASAAAVGRSRAAIAVRAVGVMTAAVAVTRAVVEASCPATLALLGWSPIQLALRTRSLPLVAARMLLV